MKYEKIKGLEDEKFRRLTGVKRSTFGKQWKACLQKPAPFIEEILNHPKLFIIGTLHDLG